MNHQPMVVQVGKHIIESHTKGFVVLKDLTNAGNGYRYSKGLPVLNIAQYVKSDGVNMFIGALIRAGGGDRSDYIYVTGKGRGAKTMVCIELAIKVAMKMDADFEVEVIRTFLRSEIFKNRLKGGDQFKILNRQIDRYLPDREGKSNTHIYIDVAKMIRAKCNLIAPANSTDKTWNQAAADGIAQELRYEYEVKLTSFLELGLVRNWNHLKEIINKL